MTAQRFTPTKKIRLELTLAEAQAVFKACDDQQEENRKMSGSHDAALARAMRKLGPALVHAGGAKVR